MTAHRKRLILTIALAVISVTEACSDSSRAVAPLVAPGSRLLSFVPMSSCGASFTAISHETDSLMTAYGIGLTVDTVNVCESWTGSDYDYQVTEVGSSDNLPGFTDTVQTVAYQSGYVTGYTLSGASAADPSGVGSTLFDLMRADNPTRQASYDSPYYGVSSHDPSTCLQAPCPALLRSAQSAQSTPDTLFKRHGLIRRGVRAIVDASEEITRSPNGYRRFRAVQGDATVIRSVDPVTELLMDEESTSPQETMRVTHKWTKVAGGYLRDRSDYISTEIISGKKVTSFGNVELTNVKISDPADPPLALPTSK